MPGDYMPAKTNAERRAEQFENIKDVVADAAQGAKEHLKHRLSPRTIIKEIFNHVTDKVIPHGADEIGNVLFSGSAYLPWPGEGGPKPIEAPAVEESIYSPTAVAPTIQPMEGSANPYMTGSYEPQAPQSPGGPGGLYLNPSPAPSSSPAREAPTGQTYSPTTLTPDQPPVDTSGLYLGQLTQSIANRGQDKDRGRSR